jgi:hypothetical protein
MRDLVVEIESGEVQRSAARFVTAVTREAAVRY